MYKFPFPVNNAPFPEAGLIAEILLYVNFAVINWTCWRKFCSSRLQTNIFDVHDDHAPVVLLKRPTQHDHYSDEEMVQNDSFREVVEQRVRDHPSRPIKRAYDATASTAACGGYLRLSNNSIPEFHRVRSSVSRAKREEVPMTPRNLNDVNITGVWAHTWTDLLCTKTRHGVW